MHGEVLILFEESLDSAAAAAARGRWSASPCVTSSRSTLRGAGGVASLRSVRMDVDGELARLPSSRMLASASALRRSRARCARGESRRGLRRTKWQSCGDRGRGQRLSSFVMV